MDDTKPELDDMITVEPLIFIPRPFSVFNWTLTSTQVADLLEISEATLRGWISRGQFPPRDGQLNGKTPYWKLGTIAEYLRNAPGGRLPYQVG